jgi:hypothetical protein
LPCSSLGGSVNRSFGDRPKSRASPVALLYRFSSVTICDPALLEHRLNLADHLPAHDPVFLGPGTKPDLDVDLHVLGPLRGIDLAIFAIDPDLERLRVFAHQPDLLHEQPGHALREVADDVALHLLAAAHQLRLAPWRCRSACLRPRPC